MNALMKRTRLLPGILVAALALAAPASGRIQFLPGNLATLEPAPQRRPGLITEKAPGEGGVVQPDTTPNSLADLHRIEERARKVAAAVRPAVVAVEQSDIGGETVSKHHQPFASGVIISPDGLILSQYHVSHWNDARDFEKSRKPGTRVKVVLADGTAHEAELLGADRTADLSLLRLVKAGKYPHVPLDPAAGVKLGEWVLKVGHPFGYRPDRPPVVRIGRVLCRTGDSFCADCPITGGDSGGPYFDLEGRLVGIVRNSAGTGSLDWPDALTRGLQLHAASSNSLIKSCLPAMQKNEVAALDARALVRSADGLLKAAALPVTQWAQGADVRKAFREVIKPARASVVAIRDGEAVVAQGTVVGADGWILTKASELPAKPKCVLPDGRVLDSEVIGVDPAFDLALLRVAATNLTPVRWAERSDPVAGTMIAAVGSDETPLAVGIVSVPRRDLKGPFPAKMAPRPKAPAAIPEVIGSAVQGRGYWVEYVEGAAADAGIRSGDVILTIGTTAVRSHQDLAGCVRGRWAGETVPVRLLRAGKSVDLTMRLRGYGEPPFSLRADDFPTVFEHDAPALARECGGPVVGLDGTALGVTIARVGPHGCMAIPGDRVQKLLPDLKSGKLVANWLKPVTPVTRESAPSPRRIGQPVALTVDDLRAKLAERRDGYKSLLVEYDAVTEAHVEPRLLMAWRLHTARDYQVTHTIAFSGEKRFARIRQSEVMPRYAPQDLVTGDSKAPPEVVAAVERDRRMGATMRAGGRLGHLFLRTSAEVSEYRFDGKACFRMNEFTGGRLVEVRPESFYSPDMYLSGLGLRPLDPRPTEELKRVQSGYRFPDNFAGYTSSRLLAVEEYTGGAACVILEATGEEELDGKRVKWSDRLWFDPKLGYSPRRWERRKDGALEWVRTNTRFEEFAPGAWLPLESTWTIFAPSWAAAFRDQPAYSFHLRLRTARVNDVRADTFGAPVR